MQRNQADSCCFEAQKTALKKQSFRWSISLSGSEEVHSVPEVQNARKVPFIIFCL